MYVGYKYTHININIQPQTQIELNKSTNMGYSAMRSKIAQLSSDLLLSKTDMHDFVKQATDDKMRIVEAQQQLSPFYFIFFNF